MIRTLAILCFIASPAFGIWEKGLKVRFGTSNFGTDYFISMPQNVTQASNEGWVNRTDVGPTAHTGYESLELWCPQDEFKLCLLYDDTGYVAGMQIGLNPNICIDNALDWTKAGFTKWTPTINGTELIYWTTRVYFISTDMLATSAANRTACRDDKYILQGDYYYVTGFNGILMPIPVDHTELASGSSFTKQSCFIGMGQHYYYKMTSSLECSADTILTWFPLDYNEQTAGVGFMFPVNCTFSTTEKSYFENPSKSVIKSIVYDGPNCLYDYGDTPGVLTMHIYFIKNPYYITCLW